MHKIKWKKVLVTTLLMGTCFSAGIYASDGIEKVEAFLRSDFKVKVDGVDAKLVPLVYNSTTYLPLRTLAGMVGAEVNWDNATQTIYVNKRIPATPLPSDDLSYSEEFEIEIPDAYIVTYLGRSYPLVTSRVYANSKEIVYYRAKDLQAMGIDTTSFRKAIDKITDELYVRQEELDIVLKENFKFDYPDDTIVTGETNLDKLDVLRNFSLTAPLVAPLGDELEYNRKKNTYPRLRNVYYIDHIQDNEYELLHYNRKYFKYKVKLSFEERTINNVKKTYWYVSEYSSIDLQPEIIIDYDDRD